MTNETSGASLRFKTTYSDCMTWLTHNFRVLSDVQAAHVRGVSPSVVRQTFRRLERSGLVTLSQQLVQCPSGLGDPLYEWKPDAPPAEPNWDALCWKNESRWNTRPRRVLVASATKKAMQQYGGYLGGRPERQLETQHDLAVTQLFLSLREQNPELDWTPEDALTGFAAGDKKPDAVLCEAGQEVFIELVGRSYSARKLRSIHKDFATRGKPYRMH